jgi:hypothetical protein
MGALSSLEVAYPLGAIVAHRRDEHAPTDPKRHERRLVDSAALASGVFQQDQAEGSGAGRGESAPHGGPHDRVDGFEEATLKHLGNNSFLLGRSGGLKTPGRRLAQRRFRRTVRPWTPGRERSVNLREVSVTRKTQLEVSFLYAASNGSMCDN